MKVINIHRRIVTQPQEIVSELLRTVSAKDDKFWPFENWPAIKFLDGLKIGSKGGHGIIRYTIIGYNPDKFIKFKFTKPAGFNGTHELLFNGITADKTEIIHKIIMSTSGFSTIYWVIAIRWLHDALIEDAFDKLESHFSTVKKEGTHSLWVRLLRYVLKPTK